MGPAATIVHALMEVFKYSLNMPAMNNSPGTGSSSLALGQGVCLAPWSGPRERVRAQVVAPGQLVLAGIQAKILARL